MEDRSREIGRSREDQYFQKLEQERLEQLRRKAAKEAETQRLMDSFGIRDPELVHELAEAGFDAETLRLLYLVPLIQIAWSDGSVSGAEREQVLRAAALHGIEEDSPAHERLVAWLTERPPESFFQACLRGIKAMLSERPEHEARSLSHDLAWYCTRVASASGGFLGLGSKISREEEAVLAQLAAELDSHHPSAAQQVAGELSSDPESGRD